jgi:hypothetical protein
MDGVSHDLEQSAGDQVFLLSSMQHTAIVLMHMFHELALLKSP